MLKLFEYNWQVRKDWFAWCDTVSEEELLARRTGGIGSILYTLHHIVTVEYAWLCGDLQGKELDIPSFDECASVQGLRDYSDRTHAEIAPFIYAWNDSLEDRIMVDTNQDGEQEYFTFGEVMRHVIAHEIHHIGQLSIWSREIGKKPVTANLIRRGLFDKSR